MYLSRQAKDSNIAMNGIIIIITFILVVYDFKYIQ